MTTWKPWSKEVFDEAGEQLKLVVLMLVSDLNNRSNDSQFELDAQEVYTFEEIEKNFVTVKVVVEERPDIELLLSPGYYPCTLILSPEGRIITLVRPKEQDLYEVLFQARRQYINDGKQAGVPMGMPAYPVQGEGGPIQRPEAIEVCNRLLGAFESEIQRIAQPLSAETSIGFEGQMLIFGTQAGLALNDEHATGLVGSYMEHIAATLWDPQESGFFASIQGDTPLPIKKLSHQLQAMEALVNFSQQDESSSERAIAAILQAIEGNFSKDEGLYSTYSSTTRIYTAENMNLLRCLLLAAEKQLLPPGLEQNITAFAQRLLACVADEGRVHIYPLEPESAALPLLSTQVSSARALFQYFRYSSDDQALQKGLRALGYAISQLMLPLGGVLMTRDPSERLPLLRPLDANMNFVEACYEAADLTGATMYGECARGVLAMFRENYSGFGNQKFTYGSGLLAMLLSE